MKKINLTYKKPKRFIDLVYDELGEVTSERASIINKILWRRGSTIEKVNEALIELERRGKVKQWMPFKEGHPKYNPNDPFWSRTKWDDDDAGFSTSFSSDQ